MYKDITRTANELVSWDTTYHPDSATSAVYQDLYEKWKKIYEAQLTLSDNNITRYMWAAPGL